jgi:hypothetical protein
MQFAVDARQGTQHPIGLGLLKLRKTKPTLNGEHLFDLGLGEGTAVLCGYFQRH